MNEAFQYRGITFLSCERGYYIYIIGNYYKSLDAVYSTIDYYLDYQ